MKAGAPSTVLQRHEIPSEISSLTPLRADYADLFTVVATGASELAPEQWARVALEGASPAGRFVVWQILCGLRLDPQPSPGRVAGWELAERGEDWIRLEAASWFMTAHAVVQVAYDSVSIGLFVRYERSVGAPIWTALSVAHRRLMPGLLRNAVRRIGLDPR